MSDDKRILLGMSGGVDSSVAAYILKEQGYDVVGVTLMLIPGMEDTEKFESIVVDARKVAEKLNIEHYTIDLRDSFEKDVISPFVNDYMRGRTPNPCVYCNKKIKFGKLFDIAEEKGAKKVATGHYAFIDRSGRGTCLKRGLDLDRDQSYFLYGIKKEFLDRIEFPLASLKKYEVRAIAEKIGLDVSGKSDSEEICFIVDDDYRRFLSERNCELNPGEIVNSCGEFVKEHSGIINYTVGQRRGLGIALGSPVYVTDISGETNTVVVGPKSELMSKALIAEDINILVDKIESDKVYTAKVRHGKNETPCKVSVEAGKMRLDFSEPVRAVCPGQSAVVYDGDIIVGGGIISKRIKQSD